MGQMKEPKTTLREVNGMTYIMHINGVMKSAPVKLVFRITKDERGKTNSLADEKLGVMLVIPLEPVEDLL